MGKIMGVDEKFHPSEHLEEIPTVVVLVQGEVDYAAYIGHGSKEWVMRSGDKISFEEACIHFPDNGLVKALYRK